MARWDEILTLPVQNPPTLEFSAADIIWSRVEGWRETMDRLALIPFTRVNDFVRGESNNKDCPTKFHVEARRRRPPETAFKPKVDGILEYILYWCSFGPDDHRKGGVVRPSRNFNAKRKTPAGRPNTKRGCVCHFIVKRLIAEPSVALIIYNKDKHVDKKGLPCHGPQDRKAAGTQAMFAPYISDELRLQIVSLLHVGVPVETIMQRHTEAVEKQGGPHNRDDLLTHRYVRRLERKIRRSTYELDSDDAISTGIWIENHRDHIFFCEDFSNSEPFVLGIQTEWQLQQLIRFGNHSILAADSKFGTNKLKYPVYSLLVFDSNNNAIPVAWILTPNFASCEIHRWMGALYDRVRSKDPTWKLGGFIVDDPSADVVTIRDVFHCSVLISFWRVRHAWHKKLMEKCSEIETRAEILRRLGDIVASICSGNCDIDSFEEACRKSGVKRFVLISSILVNGAAMGQILNPAYIILNVFGLTLIAKLQAEKYIRRSGINYTIIRPGGLRDDPPTGNIVMQPEDTLYEGTIAREQVAEVAAEALFCQESFCKVVEIVARPEAPKRSLPELFSGVKQK